MTDRDLLRQYTVDRSEAAFARLMDQHMKLVYWTSRRDVQDPQLAEDVAQTVFTLLARKAPTLGKDVSISGWLFNTTRLASKNALRREATRRRREQRVALMIRDTVQDEVQWRQIEPWLNDGLATLPAVDREAILLRYFGDLSFPELAGELGVSEEAARMRISRAVGKLRNYLTKREVVTTAAVLTALLAEHAAEAAPASCHAAVLYGVQAAGVFSGGTAAAAGHSTLAHLTTEILRHLAATAPAKLVVGATAVTVIGLACAAPFLLPHARTGPAIPAAMAAEAAPEVSAPLAALDSAANVTADATSVSPASIKASTHTSKATPAHSAATIDLNAVPDPFKSGDVVDHYLVPVNPEPAQPVRPASLRLPDRLLVSAPADVKPPIVARDSVKTPTRASQVEPDPIIVPQRNGPPVIVPRRDWPPIILSTGDSPPTIVLRRHKAGDSDGGDKPGNSSAHESKKAPSVTLLEPTSTLTIGTPTEITPNSTVEVK